MTTSAVAFGAMVPYIDIPPYKLFGLIPIQPFGVLVGIGIVVGYQLARRRARLVGQDPDLLGDTAVWAIASGFVFGHLVSVIFYFPERIVENPLTLFAIWGGLSSFGGLFGGILGTVYFLRKNGVRPLAYADTMIFGIIPGFVFGRAGCAVVHDHPGTASDFFLAVQFPGGARHDLGLYEMIYLILLTGIMYAVRNVRPFLGFHSGLALILYAPVRFAFDFLRTVDRRYFGMTPGHFFAIGMFGLGVWLMIHGVRLKKQGITPESDPALPQKKSPTRKPKAKGGRR